MAPKEASLSLLERVDLHLARALAEQAADEEGVVAVTRSLRAAFQAPGGGRREWISGLLRLRGLGVRSGDVDDVLAGRAGRFHERHQELHLIQGLDRALGRLVEAAAEGRAPDGWFLAELFKTATRNIPRFRNNALRRDAPWDGLLHRSYPEASELPAILDTFDRAHHYRDVAVRFEALHPVRQSFRVLWRMARIAPFPDFNMVFATLAMNGYLLAAGYPPIGIDGEDRPRLEALARGGPPLRITTFERRLLDRVGG